MVLLKVIFVLMLIYGFVGIIASFFMNENTGKKISLPMRIPSLIVGIAGLFLLSFIVKIGPQDVGVKVTPSGVVDEELHTGWHIIMPWVDVYKMDKTVWVYTCANAPKEGSKPDSDAIWAPTIEGIKIGFDISVSWRISQDYASWIYENVTEDEGGDDSRYGWLEDNVIRAKLKSALALEVSNYTPIEVYSTKREEIQEQVLSRIIKEVKAYHILVDNVDIREVYYNPDYEKAINAKKLAEQEALRLVEVTKQREELLKQERINKDIAVTKAKGESEALRIKGQSITANPKIIQLEWIEKWDGKLPVYMLSDGKGIILDLGK